MRNSITRRLAKLEDTDLERVRLRLRRATEAYQVADDIEAAEWRITDLTGGALSRFIQRGQLPLPPVRLTRLLWEELEPSEIPACDAYMMWATRFLWDWLWGPYTEEDAARDYHRAQGDRAAAEIRERLS